MRWLTGPYFAVLQWLQPTALDLVDITKRPPNFSEDRSDVFSVQRSFKLRDAAVTRARARTMRRKAHRTIAALRGRSVRSASARNIAGGRCRRAMLSNRSRVSCRGGRCRRRGRWRALTGRLVRITRFGAVVMTGGRGGWHVRWPCEQNVNRQISML